ncbi:protoporphyrinogen oxidase [Thermocrinis albus DSM 14484]|uniref:Coproporphyrinogen III oxidase n=1 Tax=Thermocrinis albus (strain DSM 14484 / JCM 11386 / HI 11/12) TaxID=638303 RepID=D3SMD2_THEAH|nr:protoporphyrinogen oxidase [Thermocrinis albus]ADC89912.1 protoporphyrinogen oxidase [Thermocrinis albus DSM 14484]
MMDVIVVGAGISGLSVAFRLSKEGLKVKVLEKEEEPGGNIRTRKVGDFLCELGPQTVLADGEVVDFFREVGIQPQEASPSSSVRYIYKRGKLIPLPNSPVKFLTSPLLSLGGKLRVLMEPFVAPSVKTEETVAQFVRRRLGEEFLHYVITPFVRGVYAGDPEELSIKYAFRRVYQLEREYGSLIRAAIKLKRLGPPGKIISFEGGNQSIIQQLASYVDLETENVALRIRRKDDRYILDTKEGKYEARCVVVASPATSAGYLLRDISWSAAQELDKIYYAPVVVVHVATSQNIPDGFGFLAPQKEDLRILGVLFSSRIFPNKAPQGKELLTIYMGGATDPEVVEYEDELIMRIVEEDLRKSLGLTQLEFLLVTRWKRAIPQYTLGYGRYIELVEALQRENPGLFITGNYLEGVSVADCIKRSKRVVQEVVKFFR